MTSVFSGALVTLSADQTIPNDASSPVDYGVEQYDHGDWFDVSSPRRFIVPDGVSRVRVIASYVYEHNSTGVRQGVIKKNGAFVDGGGVTNTLANDRTTTDLQVQTAVLDVVPGDYFETEGFQNAGGNLLLLKSTGSWFFIEKV